MALAHHAWASASTAEWLRDLNLTEYAPAFRDLGVDQLSDVRAMDEEDVGALCAAMRKYHCRKFRSSVNELRSTERQLQELPPLPANSTSGELHARLKAALIQRANKMVPPPGPGQDQGVVVFLGIKHVPPPQPATLVQEVPCCPSRLAMLCRLQPGGMLTRRGIVGESERAGNEGA